MPRPATHTVEVAKRNAEARFQELVDELRLLTMNFPHLREAFDPEDLPVSFLLKRGADREARRLGRSTRGLAKGTAARKTKTRN